MEGYRRDQAHLVAAGIPLALVRPRTTEQVSKVLAWAHAHRVPVVPRGAGTGLSGGAHALDDCLVLSLERMNSIRSIDPVEQVAVVEAGVINADLGRAALDHGLFYAPDPGSWETSTIGGNLATNAGGLRCVKYGVTRTAALGLEAVLPDGRVLRTGRGTVKDVAGYDLNGLLVGSEGTLAVITSATVRLLRLPARPSTTFIATFPTLASAGDGVQRIVSSAATPSLLELMDRPTINAIEDYRRLDLDRSAAALLIGQADGPNADADVQAMLECVTGAGATFAYQSQDAEESAMLLTARRLAGTAVMARGPCVIDDVAVPRSRLVEMLIAVETIAARTGTEIATVCHAGDGNLHPVLMLPDMAPETVAAAMHAAESVCAAALGLGGTITGEHGVGSLKRPWLRGQLDDVSLDVHAAIKASLDPHGILNPGRGF